ncbi:MAG TPA: LysM peptidoglycan-binding domain-containing protein [bacterium]|nr:LysM peptidoglycan-binding domain-containing protein [bacterium]
MRRQTPVLVVALVLLTALAAGGGQLDPDRVYTVQRGDTLWDLAEEFLGSPWLWPLIWQANPAIVEHPHWIYPGEEIYIPPNVPPELPTRIQVRIRDDEPIVALTREQLVALWRRLLEYGGMVVPDIDEYWELAHIVASADEDRTMIALYDEVYISGGDDEGFYPGAQFLVYRDKGLVVVPDSRIDVGRLIQNVGVIEVTDVFPEVSRAKIIACNEAVFVGDKIRFREDIDSEFLRFRTGVEPPVWESEEEALAERGYVCWERDGRSYAAQGHVVYINWGTDQGLEPGSRVIVWRSGRTVDDPVGLEAVRLPDEKIGTLGVLKVTDSTATCLVLGNTTRIEIGDYVDYVRR